MRVQFTKWAADAWAELIESSNIPLAFKKCGLCNDKNGSENHLIKCQNLLSYEAPSRDFVKRKKPYTKEELRQRYETEISMVQNANKKKKLMREFEKL